jgi:hypothetical protein
VRSVDFAKTDPRRSSLELTTLLFGADSGHESILFECMENKQVTIWNKVYGSVMMVY